MTIYRGRDKQDFGKILTAIPVADLTAGFFLSQGRFSIHPTHLLFLSGLILVFAGLLLYRLVTSRSKDSVLQEESAGGGESMGVGPNLGAFLPLFFMTLCVWASFVVVDNVFYGVAQQQSASTQELTALLGLLGAVNGGMSLMASLIVIPYVFEKVSLPRVLVMVPGALFLAHAVTIASLEFQPSLIVVTFLKTMSYLGVVCFHRVALVHIYSHLQTRVAKKIQSLNESVFYPIGFGFAGFLVFLFGRNFSFSASLLIFTSLIFVMFWCLAALKVSFRILK